MKRSGIVVWLLATVAHGAWWPQQQEACPPPAPAPRAWWPRAAPREEATCRRYAPPERQGKSGGAQWVIMGAIASALAVSARQTMSLFVSRARRAVEASLWTLVEVSDSEDPKLYRAVVRWLHARQLLRSGSYKAMSSVTPDKKKRQSFRSADDVALVPLTVAGDAAAFAYRGRRIWARLDGVAGENNDPIRAVFATMRPGAARRAAKAAGGKAPKIVVSTLGEGQSEIALWLREALGEAEAEDRKHVEVYELSAQQQRWELSALVRKRPVESVVLADGLLDDLVADVKAFIDDEAWYRERSLPHRRGYLLYGPPGSGKSSCILAVASHFGLPLCHLSLERLGKLPLSEALASAPPCSLVCLEDVDVALNSTGALDRRRDAGAVLRSTDNGQSLHELLNAIDGVASQDGRLLFLTTNDKDSLDPALVRPGRCDRTFYLGDADADMAARLFSAFYRSAPDDLDRAALIADLAPRFAAVAKNHSMAAIQGLLLGHKDDPEAALRGVHRLAAPAPAGS